MKITVTKKDIEAGIHRAYSTCSCPIWHAISRKLGLSTVEWKYNPLLIQTFWKASLGNLRINLPEVAVEWQRKAIASGAAKPFKFEAKVWEASDD